MKWLKRILLFVLVVFLYFLPSLIFRSDLEFYDSLEGPKLPSIVFPIVWSIIYVLMGIFVVSIFDKRKDYNKKDFTRVIIFLVINYVIKQSLFLGYVTTLLSFLTITLTTIESLLLSKKTSFLLLPYVLWGIVASVFSILLYLNN